MIRLLASIVAVTPQSADLARKIAAIEQAVEEGRKELGVPGVAVALIQNDQVVLRRGFGLRDVERNLPVTPETRFAIGSCSKAFTAMAAVISADEGKLSLEDPPRNHLPYFRLRDPDAAARITIRDLLRHTSGLDRTDLSWSTGVLSREEVIRVAGLAKPTARLGERFQYQNSMYSAAGEIVGRANGTTWEEYIDVRLFKPLGMSSSDTSVGRMTKAPDHATGYALQDRVAVQARLRDLASVAPAGAINSNVQDMTRWIRLMLGGGAIDGKRLVSEKGFQELVRTQISLGGRNGYGLGWAVNDWNGTRVLSHGGSIDGFNALAAFVPDRRIGLVALTNVSASALPERILDAVLKNLVGPPAAAPGARPSPPPEAPVRLGVEDLMSKVIAAAGGEANLRGHRSTRMTVALSFETQGLTGVSVVEARAPNLLASTVTVTGLGKTLGTMRSYFDGAQGGAEYSFAPKEAYKGGPLEDARVAADFYEGLNWKSLYRTVTIREKTRGVYVVVKTPEKGSPVTDHYSATSFLLMKRERTRGTVAVGESYDDYRRVQGVMIPFQTLTDHPLLGRVVGKVKDVQFDVDLPPAAFRASR